MAAGQGWNGTVGLPVCCAALRCAHLGNQLLAHRLIGRVLNAVHEGHKGIDGLALDGAAGGKEGRAGGQSATSVWRDARGGACSTASAQHKLHSTAAPRPAPLPTHMAPAAGNSTSSDSLVHRHHGRLCAQVVAHQRALHLGSADAVARHVDHVVHAAQDPVVAAGRRGRREAGSTAVSHMCTPRRGRSGLQAPHASTASKVHACMRSGAGPLPAQQLKHQVEGLTRPRRGARRLR